MRIANKCTNNIGFSEYESRMESVEIDCSDISALIMDYLLCDGICQRITDKNGENMPEQMQTK